MTILNRIVLYHKCLTNPGGGERLLLEEYSFLKRKGIEAIILTFQVRKEALFNYKVTDLEILSGNSFAVQLYLLRERLREIKPNLVRCIGSPIDVYFATRFTNIPYVLQLPLTMFWFPDDLMKYALIHRRVFNEIRESVYGHKEFIPLKPRCSPFKRIKAEAAAILDYLAIRNARAIFCHSPQIKWEIKRIYGKDAIILRGAIRSEMLTYNPKYNVKKELGIEGKKMLLSVSRLDPRKRVDVIIKAFAKISAKYNNIALVVVGKGSEEKKLKALANSLGVKVIFTGYVSDDKLWDYYAACDVFVTPAYADFDITPYEALAFGKRVVWSSEMSEDLLKDERVVVANPTPEEFAEGIEKALALDVDESKKIDLTNYTWDSYFEKVLSIYENIIRQKAIQRSVMLDE